MRVCLLCVWLVVGAVGADETNAWDILQPIPITVELPISGYVVGHDKADIEKSIQNALQGENFAEKADQALIKKLKDNGIDFNLSPSRLMGANDHKFLPATKARLRNLHKNRTPYILLSVNIV